MAKWLNDLTAVKNFDKLVLSALFIITIILCVHLMHKSDAGGDETTFLVWAEATSTTLLGALLGLIRGESSSTTNQNPNVIQGDQK